MNLGLILCFELSCLVFFLSYTYFFPILICFFYLPELCPCLYSNFLDRISSAPSSLPRPVLQTMSQTFGFHLNSPTLRVRCYLPYSLLLTLRWKNRRSNESDRREIGRGNSCARLRAGASFRRCEVDSFVHDVFPCSTTGIPEGQLERFRRFSHEDRDLEAG